MRFRVCWTLNSCYFFSFHGEKQLFILVRWKEENSQKEEELFPKVVNDVLGPEREEDIAPEPS